MSLTQASNNGLSRLSFGIYLNHFLILALLHPPLCDGSKCSLFGYWVVYFLFVCLFVSLLVAMTTFLLFEWPFLRIRTRWLDHARPRTQQLPTY